MPNRIAQLYLHDSGSTLHTLSSKWKNHLSQSFNNEMGKRDSIFLEALPSLSLRPTPGGRVWATLLHKDWCRRFLSRRFYSALPCTVSCLSFEVNLPIFLKESIHCVNILSAQNPNYRFSYATNVNVLPKRLYLLTKWSSFWKTPIFNTWISAVKA